MSESEESTNRVVLTSPNREFRIALELFDNGYLQMLLSVREPDGTYKQRPTVKTLAWVTPEQPTTNHV
jgi:hypothetical protein